MVRTTVHLFLLRIFFQRATQAVHYKGVMYEAIMNDLGKAFLFYQPTSSRVEIAEVLEVVVIVVVVVAVVVIFVINVWYH